MKLLNFSPDERRILVVVTDDEEYILRVEPDGRKLLAQPQVKLISIEDLAKQKIRFVGREGRPQPGMVLLLSPFNDFTYMDLLGLRHLVAIEKMHVTTRLCQLLGAKSVSIERLEIIDNERNESVSWDVEGGGIAGSLKGKVEDIQKLRNALQLDVEFIGGDMNRKKALDYFNTSRLDSDTSIGNIFNMRLDNNPVAKIKQEISLSESLQSSMDLLASLHLPEIFTKLKLQSLLRSSVSIEQTVKENIDIKFRISVEF